jgi:hypothetical protein
MSARLERAPEWFALARLRQAARATARAACLAVSLAAAAVAPSSAGPAQAAPAATPGAATTDISAAWEAWDHLDPDAGAGAAGGWRLEAQGVSREAVRGEWESALRLAREPAHGFGFTASWQRAWSDRGGPADDTSASLVRRGAHHRMAAGVGRLAFAGESLARALLDVRVQPVAPLLAGVRVSLYPSQGAEATEAVAALDAGFGPWWGGLEVGPGTADLRIALGLRAGPGLAWTAAYTGAAPTMGIALRRGAMEVRAEQTAHPLLGRVSRIRLVLGGGR